jgi:Concanavalin A-like lectin/glucanases superfamily
MDTISRKVWDITMYITGTTIQGLTVQASDPTTYVTANLVMNLDAGLSSSFSGNTQWIDTISGLSFTLTGSPTFSSDNGGYLNFASGAGQYAQSPNQSFGSLTRFTTEAWHYYNGVGGGLPCLLTEVFPGANSKINYILGTGSSAGLQAGFFDGAFKVTPGYTMTVGNWYHIVGTYDGAAVKLFINNTMVYNTSAVGTPTSSTGGIRLMRRWDNADYWYGRLGVVRIYNTAFSNVQIDQNYQAVRSRFGI